MIFDDMDIGTVKTRIKVIGVGGAGKNAIDHMIENEVLNFFGIYPVWGTIIPQIILFIALTVLFIIQLKKNKKLKAKAESKNVIDDALEENVESDEVSEIQEGEADAPVAEATEESVE